MGFRDLKGLIQYFNFHTLFAPANHIAPSYITLFESENVQTPEGKLILDQVIPSEEYQDRFDDPYLPPKTHIIELVEAAE